jgi:hypothetical protein
MSIRIIQQQPTRLHLGGDNVTWMAQALFVFLCSIVGAYCAYTSGQVIHLECPGDGPTTRCQLTRWRQTLGTTPERPAIAPVQSAAIREEPFDGGTTDKLILATPDRAVEFPDLSNQAARRAADLINALVNPSQPAAPFQLTYSNQASSSGWTAFWLFFAMSGVGWLLFTPISVDWRFDADTGVVGVDCRYIFWRSRYQKPLSIIQSIHWIPKVHNHDGGSTTSYRLDLITRSGLPIALDPVTMTRPGMPISLFPIGWPDRWSRAESEPVVLALSQFLKLPMPKAL